MIQRQRQKKNDVKGSYRDPSGHIFQVGKHYYRQINFVYKKQFDYFIRCGLYQKLVSLGYLISHEDSTLKIPVSFRKTVYKYIQPRTIPFVSYPYEWCFSQLKDAALRTLSIEKIAHSHGMVLKDATAYNIQFIEGNPLFIDTLSFDIYQKGTPWVAYRQFCEQFLAPLVLAAYKDIRLLQLQKSYPEGIPLDLVWKLLGTGAHLNLKLLAHIYLHAKSQSRFSAVNKSSIQGGVSQQGFLGILESLEDTVKSLHISSSKTVWTDYDKTHAYSQKAYTDKKRIVARFLDNIKPKTVWDIGANSGDFSQIARRKKCFVVAMDYDHSVVEKAYHFRPRDHAVPLLPLWIDITNPSSATGWAHEERMSLIERGPADMLFALALVHHLSIGKNLPFGHIARYFSRLGKYLIIEYVPKSDGQYKKLLGLRDDIFPDYSQAKFEEKFRLYFQIEKKENIRDCSRLLYLMKSKYIPDAKNI